MDKSPPKPSTSSWPFFIAAAIIVLGTPYPDLSSGIISSISGIFLIAKVGLFISVLSIAIWVKQGAIEPRAATRLIVVVYFGIYALFSPLALALNRLLPLLVLAWVHWRGMPEVGDDSPIAKIPDWGREALAFIMALVGCSCVALGLGIDNGWKFEQLNYILLWLGLNFCMLSGALVLTSGTKRHAVNAVLFGYGATLSLACLINTFVLVRDPMSWNILVRTVFVATCAMLLFQVWRHFERADVLLKVGETFLGGVLFLAGIQMVYGVIQDNGGWFFLTFFISVPLLLLGAALATLGFTLMWANDIRLGRIFENWRR
jgi:hypothetical protein